MKNSKVSLYPFQWVEIEMLKYHFNSAMLYCFVLGCVFTFTLIIFFVIPGTLNSMFSVYAVGTVIILCLALFFSKRNFNKVISTVVVESVPASRHFGPIDEELDSNTVIKASSYKVTPDGQVKKVHDD
jgi:hypothetical protein